MLTQPLQTGFVRADRAQPATSDSAGAHRRAADAATGRSQAEQRRITEILRSAGAGALDSRERRRAWHDVRARTRRGRGGAAVDRPCGGALQHAGPHARGGAAGEVARRDRRALSRRRSQQLQRHRRDSRHRSEDQRRDRARRRPSRLVAHLAWRNRQRRRRRRGAGSGAHPAAIGARPRRTIRFALWSGEEQGLLGFEGLCGSYLDGPANAAAREKFNVYFNIDPGTGPVYGWYLQGQAEFAPLFDAWLAPFKDIGARRNVAEPIGNTDHLSFTALACPASIRFRTTSTTTCARITRTWTPSSAWARRTWRSQPSSLQRSPGTRRCATR